MSNVKEVLRHLSLEELEYCTVCLIDGDAVAKYETKNINYNTQATIFVTSEKARDEVYEYYQRLFGDYYLYSGRMTILYKESKDPNADLSWIPFNDKQDLMRHFEAMKQHEEEYIPKEKWLENLLAPPDQWVL